MHADRFLAVDAGAYCRAAIERRIQHRLDLLRLIARIGPRVARHCPEAAPDRSFGQWAVDRLRVACGIEPYANPQFAAIKAFRIIETGASVACRIATPCPMAEILLKRAGAEIRVEIAVSRPCPAWRIEIDLDVAGGCEGPPDMRAIRCQRHFHRGERRGNDPDLAPHPRDYRRRGDFVYVDHQRVTLPAKRRGPDGEFGFGLAQRGAATICHGEASAGAIGGDVDADIIVR